MMSFEAHRKAAEGEGSVPIAIVTVSDTRTVESDVSGRLIRELAEAAGHTVDGYRIVKDEPDEVLRALDDFASTTARLIIFNGGTGIGRRDRTYDVINGVANSSAC
jgi:molybdenum cofactor biosynthesis protein B